MVKVSLLKTKFAVLVLMAVALFAIAPMGAYAATPVYNADVSTASSGNVLVGYKGTYNTSQIDAALKKINQIRYEACKEGVWNPASSSQKLSLSDYRPLKWSSELEVMAQLRASEAALFAGHTRPNGDSCFTVESAVRSNAENLAWNYSGSMTGAVDQWYDEKSDWVNRNSGAVTGHYTSMINPNFTYCALGSFVPDVSLNEDYPCVSMECSATGDALDESIIAGKKGKCI